MPQSSPSQAYLMGFRKVAEEAGLDSTALINITKIASGAAAAVAETATKGGKIVNFLRKGFDFVKKHPWLAATTAVTTVAGVSAANSSNTENQQNAQQNDYANGWMYPSPDYNRGMRTADNMGDFIWPIYGNNPYNSTIYNRRPYVPSWQKEHFNSLLTQGGNY